MTNPDIRSLITSKSRPKVTPRDTSLSLKRSKEVEEEAADKSEISDADDSAQINGEPQELQRLQAELDNLPQVGKRLAVHCSNSFVAVQTGVERGSSSGCQGAVA